MKKSAQSKDQPRNLEYFEKLRDPRWQKKRLEVLEFAQWTCEDCGDTESELQVHHCIYVKGCEPWDYTTNTLMALCDQCHAARQEIDSRGRLCLAGLFRWLNPVTARHFVDFLEEIAIKDVRYIPKKPSDL